MAIDTNRLLILFLLLALLYTLYRYQQNCERDAQLEEDGTHKKKRKKKRSKGELVPRNLEKSDKLVDNGSKTRAGVGVGKDPDLISVSNVSQYSLGSLDDSGGAGYKPASSGDDASIFNETSDESFFFQQRPR